MTKEFYEKNKTRLGNYLIWFALSHKEDMQKFYKEILDAENMNTSLKATGKLRKKFEEFLENCFVDKENGE